MRCTRTVWKPLLRSVSSRLGAWPELTAPKSSARGVTSTELRSNRGGTPVPGPPAGAWLFFCGLGGADGADDAADARTAGARSADRTKAVRERDTSERITEIPRGQRGGVDRRSLARPVQGMGWGALLLRAVPPSA